jgi:hypothetical protein
MMDSYIVDDKLPRVSNRGANSINRAIRNGAEREGITYPNYILVKDIIGNFPIHGNSNKILTKRELYTH